jgi:Uma2 family endonuclease
MSVQIAKRLLTVSEYHKMAEAGILTEDDRVELINGEIITMSPINSLHAGHVKRINALLSRLLINEDVVVSIQDPITIDAYSEPEPDVALLRYREDFYTDSHPVPKDVYLIIEVASSSVAYDREVKLKMYAKAGIPEYWIVNLEEGQIEVYQQPVGNEYAEEKAFQSHDELALAIFSLKIKGSDLLG